MKSNHRIRLLKNIGYSVLLSTSLMSINSTVAAETNISSEQPTKLVSIEQAKQEKVTPVVWLPGNVISRLDANLASEQNGVLQWILDVGVNVTKGQAIAQLDSREFEFQLSEKQAQLRQQQANTVYLQKQLKRLKSLLSNNSTARIEYDRTERDLSIAEDELISLKVQMKRIELAIDKTTIKAPFEGRINRRMAQQGEYITSGTVLVQMVDPLALDISIAAPLSVAPYLEREDKMLVKWNDNLVSLPVRTWSPSGDRASRSFNVRLDASNLDLMSGNAVVVSLPKEKASLSTMVPRDALILRKKETFIVTVDERNKVRKVGVVVGRGFGEWVSIDGKVSAGDDVVIRGGESLQEGQTVRFEHQIKEPELRKSESSVASTN